MPSTVGGLLLFVVFLIPGFVYYIQRRRFVELKSESALIETARLVSVSVVTNLCAFGAFSLARYFLPNHTPNPEAMLRGGASYIDMRPGYLLLWAVALMAVSSVFAFYLARLSKAGINLKWFAPDIVNTSAWSRYLGDRNTIPANTTPFVGLDLRDGTYVSGYVDWFSTELDEVPDRDLVLAAPITLRKDGKDSELGWSRLVVSARDIQRMFVSYVDPPKNDPNPPPTPTV